VERGDEIALRLLLDVARRLVLQFLERREGAHPPPLDLDDVPAELALHRIGDLAGLQFERRVGEFRHHMVLGEPAEIAAVAGRILRHFGGDLGEILAALDAGERRLGLLLGRQQDVARVDLLDRRIGLGGLVIGLVLGLVGRRRRADLVEQRLHRQLVAVVGEPPVEFGALIELVGLGLGGGELEVDEVVEQVFLARRAFELLREAGTEVLQRVGEVVLRDRLPVDLGENARVGLRAGRGEPGGDEAKDEQEGEPAG